MIAGFLLSAAWTSGNRKGLWMPTSNADVEYRFRVTLLTSRLPKSITEQKFVFDDQLGEYTDCYTELKRKQALFQGSLRVI